MAPFTGACCPRWMRPAAPSTRASRASASPTAGGRTRWFWRCSLRAASARKSRGEEGDTMTTVEKIMRRDIVAVRADEPIVKAWRSMVEQGLSGVPVVDANGQLIGIVTEGDLVGRLIPRRTPRWWDVMLRDREALARDYRNAVGTTVADVMTSAPVSIAPNASVGAAAHLI